MKGKFQRMDITQLGFENEIFDGIWCNSVIHFYKPENMDKLVSELSRALKKDGILYINFKLTEGKPESDIREEEDGSLVKRYLISPGHIKKILKKNNLEIIEEESEVNTEDFENPVWGIFCRKK